MANPFQNDLFSSLISDIKAYTGQDPLHPWLRGIRKMKESLSPLILKEKLPRFLQKCAQTFESDRRYRNDLRYLRVWIQLMDFVDDPRALLRTMEMNKIGTKQALFYQAYALYYEKLKKFEEADKMYHLGVHNLAQPCEELQKSYEQFLHRMEQHKRRKTRHQELKASMTARNNPSKVRDVEGTKKVVEGCSADMRSGQAEFEVHLHSDHNLAIAEKSSGIISGPSGSKRSNEPNTFCSDETVVKFVDTAIVGKSEPEDACHHGLVDPTINLKEAMNAINSMFREPLELEPVHRRKSNRSQPKVDQKLSNGFEVFVDECLDDGRVLSHENKENVCVPSIPANLNPVNPITLKKHETETKKPLQAAFEIFVDDEESNGSGDGNDNNNDFHDSEHQIQHPMKCSASQVSAFVFPTPRDLSCNGSDDQDVESSPHLKLIREDTVVDRFVGSTILDEPEVENACHHGLVDPTINLKEAMAAINNMFGKPIDYVRTNRPTKQAKLSDKKRDCSGFSILPDDNLEDNKQPPRASSCLPTKSDGEIDLFEPTVFTKQAMDDINEMFGKPLDF